MLFESDLGKREIEREHLALFTEAYRAIDLAKRENLTVRQLAQRLGGYSGLAMVGTTKRSRTRWSNGCTPKAPMVSR